MEARKSRSRRQTPKPDYPYIQPHGTGWRGWYSVRGERHWLQTRATQEEAHRDAMEARRGRVRHSHGGFTLAQGMQLVLDDLGRTGRRNGTVAWYRCQFTELGWAWTPGRKGRKYVEMRRKGHRPEDWGAVPLSKLGPEDIHEFIKRRRAQGVTDSTINQHLRALSRVFRLAMRQRLVMENPVALVTRPTPQEPQIRPFTRSELLSIFDAMRGANLPKLDSHGDADLFHFLFATGLRRTELAELRADCIDLSGKVLTVEHAKTRSRQVPICEESVELFKRMVAWAEVNGDTRGWIIPGKSTQRRVDWIARAFSRWQEFFREQEEENGDDDDEEQLAIHDIPGRLHAHNMRHSLGAHLARCKVSEHLIAGILGHRLAAVSITQRYMRPHGPDLLEAIRWAWRESPQREHADG